MKILYKLSTAILSLCIFPIVIFLPFFKLVVTSDVLSLFSSSSGDVLINDSYSLKNIYELILPYTEDSSVSFSIANIPQSVRDALAIPVTFFLAFFILAILSALVIFIFGLFTKKKKIVGVFSCMGIGFTLGMNIAFENFSKPLVSGTISIVELLGEETFNAILTKQSALAGILTSLVNTSSLIDIRLLNLSTCYIVMLLLFVALLVITISSVLVDWK